MRSFILSSPNDPSSSLHNFNKLNITAPGHNNHGSSSDNFTVTVRHTTSNTSSPASSSSAPHHHHKNNTSSSVFSLFSKMPSTSSKRMNRLKASHGNSINPAGPSNSNASSTSVGSIGRNADYPDLSLEQRTEAVRSSKAVLRTVKNDWSYASSCRQKQMKQEKQERRPKMPKKTSSNGSSSSRERRREEEARSAIERDLLDALNLKKEESEYDDTSEEEEDDDDEDFTAEIREREQSDTEVDEPVQSKSYEENEKSPYRFDAPDSVGQTLTEEEKKDRRAKRQAEEMEWNDGLRNFIKMRDAWTCADSEGKIKVRKSKFEDNPLRRYVRPEQYPQIYSRVIIRGADPHVPINLKDITTAMVQGWKADDQWPPKPAAPEPSFTKKKPAGSSSVGDSMMKRVFGGFGGR